MECRKYDSMTMHHPEVERTSIELVRSYVLQKDEPISDSCPYFGMILKIQSVKT